MNKDAKLAEANPLPSEETTPPVMKINLGVFFFIILRLHQIKKIQLSVGTFGLSFLLIISVLIS